MSNSARKDSTMGQMVNILSVDTQGLTELPHHVNMIWSTFLSISLSIALLWAQIGPASIAGVLVMGLMLPITSFITTKVIRRSFNLYKLMNINANCMLFKKE